MKVKLCEACKDTHEYGLIFCTRQLGHSGVHRATIGPDSPGVVVLSVWSSSDKDSVNDHSTSTRKTRT